MKTRFLSFLLLAITAPVFCQTGEKHRKEPDKEEATKKKVKVAAPSTRYWSSFFKGMVTPLVLGSLYLLGEKIYWHGYLDKEGRESWYEKRIKALKAAQNEIVIAPNKNSDQEEVLELD